jgi:hypothetical protein
MTKDKFDIDPNWKWGWSPEIDADDERGYFQTETELVGAFLYEVIKPKLSEDMWDTLIKAIHNERVSSPTGRIQTLGRVLADFLVVGAIEMDDRHNLRQIKAAKLTSVHGRVIKKNDDDDDDAKPYSATKFF